MLAVITILALVSALVLPAVGRPPAPMRLEATARTLASALRLTRARAIATNADAVLTIDVDRKLFQSSAVSTTAIDPDITVGVVLAGPERRGRSAGAIRFFADGTSSGGDIALALAGRRATIAVNWLTGHTRLDLGGGGS